MVDLGPKLNKTDLSDVGMLRSLGYRHGFCSNTYIIAKLKVLKLLLWANSDAWVFRHVPCETKYVGAPN